MKLLNVFVTLLVCSTLFGQSTKINWGEMEESGHTLDSYIPIGIYSDNYYTIQMGRKGGQLITVNKEMNIAAQKTIVTGQEEFEADLAFYRNGEIHMFSSEYESSTKTNFVRVTTIGMDAKITRTRMKKIAAVRVEKYNHRSDFNYYFSYDSSAVLMLHVHNTPYKDDAKVSFTVVDLADYSEIWGGTVKLPYEFIDFNPISVAVSPNGNVILLATIEGDKGKRLEKYSTRVFSFKNSTKFTEAEIKMDDKFISNAVIESTFDGKLLLTGFYNDLHEGKDQGIEGAFFGTANAETPENLELKTMKMDDRTIASIIHTGIAGKLAGQDQVNTYSLQEYKLRPDGSGYAIAEQRFYHISKLLDTDRRGYYFNHLIIFRFDKDKNIQWITAIPKIQSTFIPDYGYINPSYVRFAHKYNSFVSLEKEGNIYILYNDHKKNSQAKTVKDVKMMSNKKAAQATLVTIKPDGKWAKKQLFTGKDVGVVLETSSSYVVDDNKFIISAERGKKLQFGELVP